MTARLHTKFSWSMWYWTEATESLFDLTAEELFMFNEFVGYANGRKIV